VHHYRGLATTSPQVRHDCQGHGDERPVAEYLLQRAVLARARGERQLVEAVAEARAPGLTWSRIGVLLGTSPQAGQQRYGFVAEEA
jgi:hypothetical protein